LTAAQHPEAVADRRVAVDIGGTFTDLVLLEGGRATATAKTPTTPDDPSVGVETGVLRLLSEHPAETIGEMVHGTTLVANALIERKGVTTGLITTRGFRDVLEIGREQRYDLYDLGLEMPAPLAPRRRRWEVTERILADGTVDTPLDEDGLRSVVREAGESGVEAIAVCLLHGYRHAQHERRAAEVIAEELPGMPVSLSCDVAPELGEYVRTSTTVANAYVLPIVDRYLETLERRLAEQGVRAPLHVMLSSGGLASVETARRFPIRLCESGPAAGVLSAAFWGGKVTAEPLLAFDMGGTTAKACLVEGGEPLVSREHEIARMYRFTKGSGLPVREPVIDLIEIGAGGGSIARVGAFGLPVVGPDSAAGVPGPACYGLGGTEPTVTDADLLLGYLDAEHFLGGEMRLDAGAARAAIGGIAAALGLSVEEAAAGVHRVVNENMAGAARMHAIERGRDISRCTLVATGGAGPVHAWGVARSLGVRTLVFPPLAGVASAFGMLTAARAFDFVRSMPSPLADVRWDEVTSAIAELSAEGERILARAGARAPVTRTLAADVRHRGQGDAITVVLGAELGPDPARQVEDAFEAAYVSLYERRPPGVEAEVLSWRLRMSGPAPAIAAAQQADGAGAHPRGAPAGRRPIWSPEEGGMVDADVVWRAALAAGDVVRGPAVVQEAESTVVIGPAGTGRLAECGALVVTIDG
jgi:N-methylhydantoinase A